MQPVQLKTNSHLMQFVELQPNKIETQDSWL